MPSGKKDGEMNVLKFRAWASSKTPSDFRQMVLRGVLSRTDIAKECGFSRSVLTQNPTVKSALVALENDLRASRVLPQLATPTSGNMPARVNKKLILDTERLKSAELSNAALRAENHELREQLKKYTAIAAALAAAGRIQR